MRTLFAILSYSALMCACGASQALGGSALLHAPIEQQCSRYGLKGCPELVDGVLLYVDGNEGAATRKLHRAASKNVPEDLQRFAGAIAATLPASSGNAIVAILTGNASTAQVASGDDEDDAVPATAGPSATATRSERVQLTMAAPADPMRMTTESVFPLRDADRAICQIAGSNAVCVRLETGPLVVTDAMTPPGCATELLIGATSIDGRIGWIAPTGTPGFHGAKFFVRPSQSVVVAAPNMTLDDEGSEHCYITWAAFKPRVLLPDM
jgi:hypothetical protein